MCNIDFNSSAVLWAASAQPGSDTMSQDSKSGGVKSKTSHTTGSQLPPSIHQRPKNSTLSKGINKSTDDVSEARHTTEHSFLTDVADVRQMEQSLLQLLDDFHLGKLQAFGKDCTFEKMDEVRERQEHLARLHFDLDSHQESKSTAEPADVREKSGKNFDKLMNSLQDLCTAVQNLQKDQSSAPSEQPTNKQ